jgi:hypothetical protein
VAAVAVGPKAFLTQLQLPSNKVENTLYRDMRGFNYQPSYGSSGFELWQEFDRQTIDKELAQGKRLFPKIREIRLWLSWDSYIRNPQLFEERFEAALACASAHGLVVMPVLFNRWHDYVLDYGGIYIDHLLLPGDKRRKLFERYLESVVGKHAGDARIFAWDICNEPVLTALSPTWTESLRDAEYSWLKDVFSSSKELGAKAPLCVGVGLSLKELKYVEPLSDVLTVHPYFINSDAKFDLAAGLPALDSIVEFANQVKKPLLASETCWGSLDDTARAAIVRSTLEELRKRDIGWLAYVLHHSLIADAHRPEYGPMDHAGNLSFIEADGSLRPGHGVFNDF